MKLKGEPAVSTLPSHLPPGRIIVRVKTSTSATQQQGVAVSNEELRLTLRMP